MDQRQPWRGGVDEQRVAAGIDDIEPAAGTGDDVSRARPGRGACDHAQGTRVDQRDHVCPDVDNRHVLPDGGDPARLREAADPGDLPAAGDHRDRAAELIGDEDPAADRGGVMG